MPITVLLEMRVMDQYFSEPIRDIMRSSPSDEKLCELGLGGSSVVDGRLIRTVHMDIEGLPNEASIPIEYLGDLYHP